MDCISIKRASAYKYKDNYFSLLILNKIGSLFSLCEILPLISPYKYLKKF